MQTSNFTLITGCTGSIGRDIAIRLSDTCPLLLSGRSQKKLAETLQQCSKTNCHALWEYDLRNLDNLSNSLESCIKDQGIKVDRFIHCAGIAPVLAAKATDAKSIQECFNINSLSAQQIVSTLLKKRINPIILKDVVFVSSIYSRVGVKGHSTYCASKSALDGFMRALAVELAPQTRVNSVQPGAIKSDMALNVLRDSNTLEKLTKEYPLGLGNPSDVTRMVAFLLSDEANWITGQEFVVDGGRIINFSFN